MFPLLCAFNVALFPGGGFQATLVPNASGDVNALYYWDGDSWEAGTSSNYTYVDDFPSFDENIIGEYDTDTAYDLYNVGTTTISGNITRVSVLARVRSNTGESTAKLVLKYGGTEYRSSSKIISSGYSFEIISHTFITNLDQSAIDALQAGVELTRVGADWPPTCDAVWVIVRN